MLRQELSKCTILAPLIIHRDDLREELKEEQPDNNSWISKLTKQMGVIAYESIKETTDSQIIEDEILNYPTHKV